MLTLGTERRAHPNTRDTCGVVVWGHFCPLWVPILAGGGPKYGYFWGQNQASMAGWIQGEDPTWKVFYVPYHTPMHGTTLFRPTFALSRHLSRVPGVQKWLFIGKTFSDPYFPIPPYRVECSPLCLSQRICRLYNFKSQSQFGIHLTLTGSLQMKV